VTAERLAHHMAYECLQGRVECDVCGTMMSYRESAVSGVVKGVTD
jgi:hypothetical protein